MAISTSSSYEEVIRELCEFKGFQLKECQCLGERYDWQHFFIYEKGGELYVLDFSEGSCSHCDLLLGLLDDFSSDDVPPEEYDNLHENLFRGERTLMYFLYEEELPAYNEEIHAFRQWVLNSKYVQ